MRGMVVGEGGRSSGVLLHSGDGIKHPESTQNKNITAHIVRKPTFIKKLFFHLSKISMVTLSLMPERDLLL